MQSVQAHSQVSASSGSGSSSNQIKPNAKVRFQLHNRQVTEGAEAASYSIRVFSDFQSAKKAQEQLNGRSTLHISIMQDGRCLRSFIPESQKPDALDKKTIRKLEIADDCLNMAKNVITQVAKDYANITELSLQKATHKALCQLHLFKDLRFLQIDYTGLEREVERESQFNPQVKSFAYMSDETLKAFEQCPKLTELTLINIESVSLAAIEALQQKLPGLNVRLKMAPESSAAMLPPACADAEVVFLVFQKKLENNQLSVLSKITDSFKQVEAAESVDAQQVYVELKTAGNFQLIALPQSQTRKIDMKQIRSVYFNNGSFSNNSGIGQRFKKEATDLQELIICNATKRDLQQFQELSQVQTITINNSSLKKAEENFQQYTGEKPDFGIIDDAAVCDLVNAMKNLKKIRFIGCDHVSDPMLTYINSIRSGVLSAERVTDAPKDRAEDKQAKSPEKEIEENSGKEEKEKSSVGDATKASTNATQELAG